MLLALVVAHALCDYPLQGDFLAAAKNRRKPIKGVPWYQAMTAHCLIQAGAVFVITHSLPIGVLEFVCHFAIDMTKVDETISFNVDQLLHVACKFAWVLILSRWS